MLVCNICISLVNWKETTVVQMILCCLSKLTELAAQLQGRVSLCFTICKMDCVTLLGRNCLWYHTILSFLRQVLTLGTRGSLAARLARRLVGGRPTDLPEAGNERRSRERNLCQRAP